MYRIYRTLPWAAAACVLALSMACSNSPDAPAAPAALNGGDLAAAADGSTLKATPPTPISPINDVRLDNRKPTMIIGNASGRFAAGTFDYEFQLMNDSNAVIASTILSASGGTTTWPFGSDLDRDTPYRWRARAVMGDAAGPWSSPGRFFTVKEFRTPNPPPGGRLPVPDYGAGVVHQVAAQRPDLLHRSCQEHGGTWEFLDLVVDTLRERDTRWGYNGKRGDPGNPSLDIVTYNRGIQPDDGTTDVYIIDVILGHCGDSPFPAWIDQTQATKDGGTIGRWISRGRFQGSFG